MDKISHIVGNSARVGSGDAKSAPPVRPGAPAFGRTIGESPRAGHDELSTAQRVGAIRSELLEDKKARAESKIASDMAEKFFFRPQDMKSGAASVATSKMKEIEPEEAIPEPLVHATSARTDSLINGEDAELKIPSKFAPRGSFIDVRA